LILHLLQPLQKKETHYNKTYPIAYCSRIKEWIRCRLLQQPAFKTKNLIKT
jgi:hypothetical protein